MDMTLEQNTFFTHTLYIYIPVLIHVLIYIKNIKYRVHQVFTHRYIPYNSGLVSLLQYPFQLHDPTTMPKRNGTPTTSNKNESVHILVLGDGE